MEIETRRRRRGPYRKHPEEFKRRLVSACLESGASVAGIAVANGVNPNLLRKWIEKFGPAPAVPAQSGLVEVCLREEPVSAVGPPPIADGRIELELRGARIRLFGRVDAETLQLLLRSLGR
jgi:transposase